MKKIIADAGSTKIEWLLLDDEKVAMRCMSKGLNPSLQEREALLDELHAVATDYPQLMVADAVEYYGAGCTVAASTLMEECLREVFTAAHDVLVGSDIIGAARSLLGTTEGIACILGTGANSCLWDGHGVVRQTPALGYVLGDEGSGAVLGKLLLNALYKGVLPASLREDFEREYGVDMMGVIEHVYRQPQPNRWLASLSPFVARHLDMPEVEALVCSNLEAFIVRNILPYQRPDLAVCFVGSIAYHYQCQLRAVAERHGVTIGKILKSPLPE